MIAAGLVLGTWILGWCLFWPRRIVAAKGSVDLRRLSIIIPARNEEQNIAKLLASLTPQSTGAEIFVVNDESTDRTAEVALSFGARIFNSSPLPEGWTGKNWACHQGAQQARGELLFFLDADIELPSEGLQKLLALWEQRGFDRVISVLPYYTVKEFYENASAFFLIFMALGTGAFTLLPKFFGRSKLVGQSMLVSKHNYLRVGGHESVRDKILENFFLSTHFEALGMGISTLIDPRLLRVRMFPSGFRQLMEGWSKAFAQGAGATETRVLVASVIWLAGSLSVWLVAIWVSPAIALILYGIFSWQLRQFLKVLGSFSWLCSFGYPIFAVFYLGLFSYSLWMQLCRTKVRWRGRNVAISSKNK